MDFKNIIQMGLKNIVQQYLKKAKIIGILVGGGLLFFIILIAAIFGSSDEETENGVSNYSEIVSGENGALLEWLRSYENDWLRQYRNGTASDNYIYIVETRDRYARKNPTTGKIDYRLYTSPRSGILEFSYGIHVCLTDGTIYYKDLYEEEGIDIENLCNKAKNGEDVWVDGDLIDNVQAKIVKQRVEEIKTFYKNDGITLTQYEAEALTAVSYAYGNYGGSTTRNFYKQYGNTEQFRQEAIAYDKEGTACHFFIVNANQERYDRLWLMFHEGRYILSTGEEVKPEDYIVYRTAGTLEGWDGDVYVSKEFTFPYYRQGDPKWSSERWGKQGQNTIGDAGCGGTSLAIIVSGFTGKANTPPVIRTVLNNSVPIDGNSDYATSGGGSYHWYFYNNDIIYGNFKCKAEYIGEDIGTGFTKTEQALNNGKCIMFSMKRTDDSGHIFAAVPASEQDRRAGYMFNVLDPSTALNGLYKSVTDLVQHPHDPKRGISSLSAVSAIGKGDNVPRGTGGGQTTYSGNLYNSNGTVNQEKIKELEKWLEQEYNLIPAGTEFAYAYANRAACEAVTGKYLGFSGWCAENKPNSKFGGCTHIYQCPWWSQGRASEVENTKVLIGGDGGMIYANAKNKNSSDGRIYEVGNTARPGAIVSYVANGSKTGHTAYVEAVDTVNKCYYISHCGSGKKWYGIQKVNGLSGAPWSGWRTIGFVYVKETIAKEKEHHLNHQ